MKNGNWTEERAREMHALLKNYAFEDNERHSGWRTKGDPAGRYFHLTRHCPRTRFEPLDQSKRAGDEWRFNARMMMVDGPTTSQPHMHSPVLSLRALSLTHTVSSPVSLKPLVT